MKYFLCIVVLALSYILISNAEQVEIEVKFVSKQKLHKQAF